MTAFTEEQLGQLAQYPKESVAYANKKLTSDLLAGKSISNPFSYLLGICKSHAAERNMAKTAKSGAANKPQPSRGHIDQALLRTLTEAARIKRAEEKRAEWESRHGKKEHDAFYVAPWPTAPADNTDHWWTPDWCRKRLAEDTKILAAAKHIDPNNQFIKFSLPVVIDRMAKCQAILDKHAISIKAPQLKQEDRQPSLFQDDEPQKLDYDALEEILD